MTSTAVKANPDHPAKWSAPILDVLDQLVEPMVAAGPYLLGPLQALDPFAGVTEGIHRWSTRWPGEVDTVGVELEPEWAACQPGTVVGDATALPEEWAGRFDIVATSCCYGNRMADSHDARDACKACGGSGQRPAIESLGERRPGVCGTCKGEGLSRRNTYTHRLGRKPSAGSAAVMEWHDGPRGDPYRRLHVKAWEEVTRCTGPSALFALNVSNSLVDDVERRVVEWHLETVLRLTVPGTDRPAWRLAALVPVSTRRQRQGANGDKRVGQEFVLVFRRRP